MKKLKKTLVGILACLTVGALAVGVAGCEMDEVGMSTPIFNGGTGLPSPSTSSSASSSEEENSSEGENSGNEGGGTVEKQPSEGLKYMLGEDGTYYTVSGIGTCTDTDIMIPSTYNGSPVESIGEEAFYYCTSLTSVVIPDSVTSIGDSAFSRCYSLTSVVIGDSVTSIGEYAFAWCDSLASVNYTGDIEGWCNITFGYYANPLNNGADLYINGELVTELVIPDTVTEIKAYAFYGCDSLTSVEIPDSVTSIGWYAFANCYSLMSVVIGDSVTSIESGAFNECTSLTSVVIPDSVTSIGDGAFDGCTSLTSVTFENTSGWWYASSSTATSGTSISETKLADTSTAATYLTITYVDDYWKRS